MRNEMTIQINSLEALERLIGDDPEIRIQLRNSVIQNMGKSHFKNVANEITSSAIRETMVAEFEKFFDKKKTSNWSSTIILKSDKRKIIENIVESCYSKLISDKLSSLWSESTNEFKKRVDAWSDDLMNKFNEKTFLEMVDKAANEKIKAKLGLK